MAKTRWLTQRQEHAWRTYRQMQMLLSAQLAADLARDSGLSEPDYDVLSTLSEKHGERWPLRDLAAKMLWSRSRLSHHLTRMEQRGLVARRDDPHDLRGCMVVLTPHGQKTLEEAAPFHVESVRTHLIEVLTDDEVDQVARIAAKVLHHLGTP